MKWILSTALYISHIQDSWKKVVMTSKINFWTHAKSFFMFFFFPCKPRSCLILFCIVFINKETRKYLDVKNYVEKQSGRIKRVPLRFMCTPFMNTRFKLVLCRLEGSILNLYYVMIPVWMGLPVLTLDVFLSLFQTDILEFCSNIRDRWQDPENTGVDPSPASIPDTIS